MNVLFLKLGHNDIDGSGGTAAGTTNLDNRDAGDSSATAAAGTLRLLTRRRRRIFPGGG